MAKRGIISELAQVLSSFSVHERLIPELVGLIKKSSHRDKAFALLVTRLAFLQEHGPLAADLHKEFERIDKEIYSMHIAVPDLNLRILYSFLDDGTIMLAAFHEREGKRSTDYTRQLPTAHRRKHEMEE